ncbi:calcium-binding protein [Falsiroseomonas sp.]|uniref:calcium-binding protein n=1 Tax=Falsiroseomonas sp. TaxID=2870721 RepID=UPI003F72C254
MATFFTNSDQTTTAANTPVYQLGDYDTLMVGPDAVLTATGTGSRGINGLAEVTVLLSGDLFVAHSSGIFASGGADIRITAEGSITSGFSAIYLQDDGHQVTNGGHILAEDFGIRLSGGGLVLNSGGIAAGGGILSGGRLELHNSGLIQSTGSNDFGWWNGEAIYVPAGSASIVNTGTIASVQGIAISLSSQAGEQSTVENFGVISAAEGSSAIIGGNGVDRVINAGTINGNIWLSAGDDIFDGTLGQTFGFLQGGAGNDTILGGAAGELLQGGSDQDSVAGGAGADTLSGEAGDDTLLGGEGDDLVVGGDGSDMMEGGAGWDILSYAGAGQAVTVDLATGQADGGATGDSFAGFEAVRGGNFDDALAGTAGAETLSGGAGADTLTGEGGIDRLHGEAGQDWLVGGAGADFLFGGAEADTFRYMAIGDSTVAASGRDRIRDFSQAEGDRIHLWSIDADTTVTGNQTFAFIGSAAFGGHARELRFQAMGATTQVQADVDGDGKADFAIQIMSTVTLTAADFVL